MFEFHYGNTKTMVHSLFVQTSLVDGFEFYDYFIHKQNSAAFPFPLLKRQHVEKLSVLDRSRFMIQERHLTVFTLTEFVAFQ